jgi:hypothetical protein
MAVSRRTFVAVGAAAISVPVFACSAETPRQAAKAADAEPSAAPRRLAMQVHKDPGCPCCDAWADHARRAGYEVSIAEDPQIAERKRKLGVPADLWSCHTTEVAGFVLEGHVPMDSVRRLLDGDDSGIAGLAVAGMPLGSPGMEAGGRQDSYQVIAFGRSGGRRVFAEYPDSAAGSAG